MTKMFPRFEWALNTGTLERACRFTGSIATERFRKFLQDLQPIQEVNQSLGPRVQGKINLGNPSNWWIKQGLPRDFPIKQPSIIILLFLLAVKRLILVAGRKSQWDIFRNNKRYVRHIAIWHVCPVPMNHPLLGSPTLRNHHMVRPMFLVWPMHKSHLTMGQTLPMLHFARRRVHWHRRAELARWVHVRGPPAVSTSLGNTWVSTSYNWLRRRL